MMPLKKLKTYIKSDILEAVNSTMSVYPDEAGNTSTFPYIVYKFPNENDETLYKEKWILEIDFWDQNTSNNILDASDLVKNALNGLYQTESEGFFRCYKVFEGTIPDDTPNIKRIQQRYEIHLY